MGTPAVANNVVYVAAGDPNGKLYAFDATANTNCSGTPKVCTPLWTAGLAGSAAGAGAPTIAYGLVYYVGLSSTL